ncbi:MAG: AAA family ATPase [Acidimicrobiales bacterium]
MPCDTGVVTLLLVAVDRHDGSAAWPSVATATTAAGGAIVVQRAVEGIDACVLGAEFTVAMHATRAALRIVEPAGSTVARAVVCTHRRNLDHHELATAAGLLRNAPPGEVMVSASTAVLIQPALPAHLELVPCPGPAPARPRWQPERLYALRPTRTDGYLLRTPTTGPPATSPRSELGWARRAAPTMLVGRSDATARLCSVWRAALAGQRRTALITGERGIGKTALAADLALAAHAAGGQILYGRSDHEARSVDLAIHGATGIGACDDGFDQLRARLDSLADHRPVLLVLDDVVRGARLEQLVGVLAEPSGGAPWMVVATARPGRSAPSGRGTREASTPRGHRAHEASAAGAGGSGGSIGARRSTGAASAPGDDDVEQIALAGLDASHVAHLVHQVLGRCLAPEATAIEWLTSATAGNPLFVRTILNSVPRPTGTEATLRAMRSLLPDQVAEVVRWRLAPLPAPTRRALACAASCPGPAVELAALAAAMSTAPVIVHSALEPAIHDDLLDLLDTDPTVDAGTDPAGARYRFRHDIVRQALCLDAVPP